MSAQTAKAAAIAADLPLVEPAPGHPSLAAALVAALADVTVVEKGRTAKVKMKAGGEYSYGYADIADVVKVTRPALASHGVVALTPVHEHGDGLAVTVTLLHTSGDRLDLGPFPFPHGVDAQATGSMVTYHRRYALVAALGIAAGDDDDGASAKPRTDPKAEPSTWQAVRADLAALPEDVRDRLVTDAEARSGGDLNGVLADDGWRKWLTDAIAAHKVETE